MLTKRPRGTNDILPGESMKWQWLEEQARSLCRKFGYQEIRTPMFEHTELFQRGVGETTDIVQKEMYTFLDRGGRSVTLRPENTAAVVRAYLENKLYSEPQPTKVFYIGPMFRYDRPQAGRFRQFHQFGIEAIGSTHPAIDAEVIYIAMEFYRTIGVKDAALHINSVGCPKCRPVHKKEVISYLQPYYKDLCDTCQGRYEKNPLRIMDCKAPRCQEIARNAPTVTQNLCKNCRTNFEMVLEYLTMVGVSYQINEHLVRGLDYYTGTAFEINVSELGAQNSIGGGGRYDYLVKEIGGEHTPSTGFALGLERILLTLKNQGIDIIYPVVPLIYIVGVGENAQMQVFKIAQQVRNLGFAAEMDFMNRSIKAQMKMADKLKAKYAVIIGDEELVSNKATIRNMETGEQVIIDLKTLEKYITSQLAGRQ
ncbi:MAG: histidine--tRNA ligase [Bacillota bacterium]